MCTAHSANSMHSDLPMILSLCCDRVTVLLNLAALHMATQQGQLAIQCCSQALSLDPKSCKALLRRAKAHLKMHNYQVCRSFQLA